MGESTFVHKSALLYETVGSLDTKLRGSYVDDTLGGDGHAYEVCKRLGSGRLIGIDQDTDAVEATRGRLLSFQDGATIIKSNYASIKEVLKDSEIEGVGGIYPDLGVSSYQLDTVFKGFTYREDAPLDMRMDQRNDVTAAHIISTYSEMELYRITRDYGGNSFAKSIAKHIVEARGGHPIEATGELTEIVKGAIPVRVRVTGGHPAKRTFQAIRIECNHELEVLKQSINTIMDLLNPGGCFSIITFHSLKNRIVKSRFWLDENSCTCSPDFPVCVYGRRSKRKVVSRKPILPLDEELEEDSRSKSTKLRVFERGQSQSEDKIFFRSLRHERQQVAGKTGPCRCWLPDSDRRENKVMAVGTQASPGRGNTRRSTRPTYSSDYVQGSAVPKLRPQSAPKQEARQGKSSGSQSVRSNHRIRRNQECAMYTGFLYVIILTITSVFILYLCINYLYIQSSITARMHHIEKMEVELEQLRVENDALETSISTSIDLNKIYEIVTKEPGMMYAKKDQVLLYGRTESEYVKQYEDIPEHQIRGPYEEGQQRQQEGQYERPQGSGTARK